MWLVVATYWAPKCLFYSQSENILAHNFKKQDWKFRLGLEMGLGQDKGFVIVATYQSLQYLMFSHLYST